MTLATVSVTLAMSSGPGVTGERRLSTYAIQVLLIQRSRSSRYCDLSGP
jgi:hypothetical protein